MMTVGDVDYFMLKGERKVVLDGVINEYRQWIQSQSYSKSWASGQGLIIVLISSNIKPKVAMAHLVEVMGVVQAVV